MKKTFLVGLATGVFLLGMVGMAQAYFITDGTDVGSYDVLTAETNQTTINTFNGDNDGKTLAWVNSILDPDTTFAFKDDPVYANYFQSIFENSGDTTPVGGGYAFELTSTSPEYFLIKTGNVTGKSGDGNSYFLFDNNVNMQWAVFNLASMGFVNIANITGISHVEEYGSNPAPEPATMLLMGTGLAGLIAANRRRKVNKS